MYKHNDSVFDEIVGDLQSKGYSIVPDALDLELAMALQQEISNKSANQLKQAGVGRDGKHRVDNQIRSDHIQWIDGSTQAGSEWLSWIEQLKNHLNRKLFLGLDFFESHYAHYSAGAFYQRHKDAFIGEQNRIVSLVAYLNSDWGSNDDGELILYQDAQDLTGVKVEPMLGTLVLFLSEEFPHEVLPAKRDRYSIAGWFRQKAR